MLKTLGILGQEDNKKNHLIMGTITYPSQHLTE